jgi:hypothetical protein
MVFQKTIKSKTIITKIILQKAKNFKKSRRPSLHLSRIEKHKEGDKQLDLLTG